SSRHQDWQAQAPPAALTMQARSSRTAGHETGRGAYREAHRRAAGQTWLFSLSEPETTTRRAPSRDAPRCKRTTMIRSERRGHRRVDHTSWFIVGRRACACRIALAEQAFVEQIGDADA